jgi:hypothetical protein
MLFSRLKPDVGLKNGDCFSLETFGTVNFALMGKSIDSEVEITFKFHDLNFYVVGSFSSLTC